MIAERTKAPVVCETLRGKRNSRVVATDAGTSITATGESVIPALHVCGMQSIFRDAPVGFERWMILVVEDHSDVGQSTVRLLAHAGYPAECVTCGTDALAFLKTAHPDLILLDYMLPDIDGMTIIQKLKADSRLCDVPVIVYSGSNLASHVEPMLAHGAAKWFVKGRDDWDLVLAGIKEVCPKTAAN